MEFSTPIVAHRDWAISSEAQPESILRLRQLLENAYDESSLTPADGRLRYQAFFEETDPHQSVARSEGSPELRRRRSVEKKKRLSLGLRARGSSSRLSICSAFSQLSLGRAQQAVSEDCEHKTMLSDLGSLLQKCLEYLPHHETSEVGSVCRSWGSHSIKAQAIVLADLDRVETTRDHEWIANAFPCGAHCAEGAYKKVFKVWCAPRARIEAISSMDVMLISSLGNTPVVSHELHASVLLSSLSRKGICPNVVEIYGLFRSSFYAGELWRSSEADLHARRPPRRIKTRTKGDFMYLRMEFCAHGDLETLLRNDLFPLELIPSILFQMCYSLLAVQAVHSMRHFDVKLLNFLATDWATDRENASHTDVCVRYGVHGRVYRLKMPRETPYCIKLADFGTSDLSIETIGAPIDIEHFTTLENTPVG
jgi:hypothetical protein